MRVCVFASSSGRINNEYAEAASHLGLLFARGGIDVVYGGGRLGLMGRLADSVLENGGNITGVIPSFMKDEGWDHANVNDMIITSDMGERKKTMFSLSDAIVALPGGVGTLEELSEAITLKQLGLYKGHIIILNTLNFYSSLIDFLENMVTGNFLRFEHKGLWEIADTPAEIMLSLSKKHEWFPGQDKIS